MAYSIHARRKDYKILRSLFCLLALAMGCTNDVGPGQDSRIEVGTGGITGQGGSPAAMVRLEGRIDYSDPAKPIFSWSGSAMIARFQLDGANLKAARDHLQNVVRTRNSTTNAKMATLLVAELKARLSW